jgi:hypothetical protein
MAADAERAEQVAAWEKAKAQKSGLALVPVTEKVEGMAKEPMPRRIPQLERLHTCRYQSESCCTREP